MNCTAWKTATIAAAAQLSDEVDLGMNCNRLLVLIPTLSDAARTAVHVSDRGVTYYPLYKFKASANEDFIVITEQKKTTKAIIFDIGSAQFVKIYTDIAQDPTISFQVQGIQD